MLLSEYAEFLDTADVVWAEFAAFLELARAKRIVGHSLPGELLMAFFDDFAEFVGDSAFDVLGAETVGQLYDVPAVFVVQGRPCRRVVWMSRGTDVHSELSVRVSDSVGAVLLRFDEQIAMSFGHLRQRTAAHLGQALRAFRQCLGYAVAVEAGTRHRGGRDLACPGTHRFTLLRGPGEAIEDPASTA